MYVYNQNISVSWAFWVRTAELLIRTLPCMPCVCILCIHSPLNESKWLSVYPLRPLMPYPNLGLFAWSLDLKLSLDVVLYGHCALKCHSELCAGGWLVQVQHSFPKTTALCWQGTAPWMTKGRPSSPSATNTLHHPSWLELEGPIWVSPTQSLSWIPSQLQSMCPSLGTSLVIFRMGFYILHTETSLLTSNPCLKIDELWGSEQGIR